MRGFARRYLDGRHRERGLREVCTLGELFDGMHVEEEPRAKDTLNSALESVREREPNINELSICGVNGNMQAGRT